MEIIDIILPIVYIVVGCALIWFVIELAITIIKVRKRAISTIDELQPSIKNIENMVEEIQPTISKVDPLVDRVTLTIDSVNLEMMRVDEILEDVGQITGTVSKTMSTVDNVANAPLDIVTSVTKKVRQKFSPKYASEESASAGYSIPGKTNPIADFADTAIDAAGEAFKEQQNKSQERKDARDARSAKREEKNDRISDKSSELAEKILVEAGIDAKMPSNSDDGESQNSQREAEVQSGSSQKPSDADGGEFDPMNAEQAAEVFAKEDPLSVEAADETFVDAEADK